MLGIVSWFDVNKGVGEITSEMSEPIFVHFSAIQNENHHSLVAGQKVKFEVAQGFKGPQAVNVYVLEH